MYTAYIKEIDTVKIVLGVDTQKIDPVATSKKISSIISATTESKIVSDKFSKIKKYTEDNQKIKIQGKRIYENVASVKFKTLADLESSDFTALQLESLQKYQTNIDSNITLIEKIQSELKASSDNLKAKAKEIAKTDGVYFDPNPNEIIINEETYTTFKAKLKAIQGAKKFLKEDGSILVDYRNQKFYALIDGVWESKTVTLLSEDVDLTIYKAEQDLTTEEKLEISTQVETDRIDNLSDEERANEIALAIESVMAQTINMRSKLEIEGDEKALDKSKAYYGEQVEIINTKYNKK